MIGNTFVSKANEKSATKHCRSIRVELEGFNLFKIIQFKQT